MQRAELARELALAVHVVDKKNVIPVLNSVAVETLETDTVRLSATDGELAVVGTCAATTTDPGRVAIPAKTLLDIVKSLSGDEVRLHATDKDVRITAGTFRARLQVQSVLDFPQLPTDDDHVAQATLPAQAVASMIRQVRFAVKGNDERYFLNGALMDMKDGHLRFVATDAHRIALSEMPLASSDEHAILPKKLMDMLVDLFEDHDGDVQYSRTERHLFVRIGSRLLISRQVEGQFPSYERVMPKSHAVRVEIPREALLDCLRRAEKVTDEKTRCVNFALEPGALVISAQRQDVGDADERIQVDYAGENVQVGLNNGYVQDFLDVAKTERVVMQLTDERSPLELLSSDASYRYIISPLVK